MTAIEEITEIINSFRKLSGVGVCFYDLDDFFRYNYDGLKENTGHYCEFCKNVKLLSGGRKLCDKSDRLDAVAMAHEYKNMFFTKCHAGLCELVVPVYNENELMGIIFLGQCRIENEDDTSFVGEYAKSLSGNAEEFESMYNALPVISRQNLLSMGRILQLYFNNLAKVSDFFKNSQSENDMKKPLAERIAVYIEKNYMNDISPKKLCDVFFLNQSYMSREFSKHYGFTITDYISKVRIDTAKKLLAGSNVPIGNIALNVGFSDANYFSRVFAKLVGKSPMAYRESKK